MRNAVIAVVVIALLGIGAFALSQNKDSSSANSGATTKSSSSSSNPDQTNSANTITYSNSGFSPSTLTVKAGDTVTIKNTSSRPVEYDSDPHPTHTDDPELNIGTVAPGSSDSFKVTEKGAHKYHNHLNPSDTGTLIVE